MKEEQLKVNKELCESLLDVLSRCNNSIGEAYNSWTLGDKENCIDILKVIDETVKSMFVVAEKSFADIPEIRLKDACKCILVSVAGIIKLMEINESEVEWKLRCELLPIAETTYFQFYYWAFVYGNPELQEEFLEEVANAKMFNNIDENIDISIIVIAYDHLDVTMGAVESVLREMPKDLSVELILYNHGSTDDTLAYFNSIEGAHIFNVAVNNAVPGAYDGAARGRIRYEISNDVVVGVDSLINMYRLMSEDNGIGWIVPATCNVSNFQPISLRYDSNEKFLEVTKANNVYDSRRHEQRVRLCNPIDAKPSKVILQLFKEMYIDIMCSGNIMSFPDDKISLWMRRNGYKMILQKDAYCHHIGSVTLKDEIAPVQQTFYSEGRARFAERFGVDPWGKGMCYDRFFYDTNKPEYEGEKKLFILGVNCGLGGDSLKVKESLKEQGADNLILVNITDEECFVEDLKGISDEAYVCKSVTDYINDKKIKQIDYLVVDEYVGGLYALLSEIEKMDVIVQRVYYKSGTEQWTIRRSNDLKPIGNKKIVSLNGGLGNQLHQYVFGRMLELKTGEQVIYDDTYFYNKFDHNGYELEKIFGVKLDMLSSHFSESEWEKMMDKHRAGVSIPQQLNDKGWGLTVIAESLPAGVFEGNIIKMPEFSCTEEVRDIYANAKGAIYYSGYWVCGNQMFELMKNIILNELFFTDIEKDNNIPAINKEYYKQIINTDSVGVHIRRGDFVDCGRAKDPELFEKAIDKMLKLNLASHFFVFSDDIQWCKNHAKELGLNKVRNLTYITGNMKNGYNYIDMQLMANCKKLIVTNSSFGIWASNFNMNPDFQREYIG